MEDIMEPEFDKLLQQAPRSTQKRLVFPWSKPNQLYSSDDWSDQFSSKITRSKMDEILNELAKAKTEKPGKSTWHIFVALIVFIILSVSGWVLIMLDKNGTVLMGIGIGLLLLALLVPGIFMQMGKTSEIKDLARQERDVRARLEKYHRYFFQNNCKAGVSKYAAYVTVDLIEKKKKPVPKKEVVAYHFDLEDEDELQALPARKKTTIRPSSTKLASNINRNQTGKLPDSQVQGGQTGLNGNRGNTNGIQGNSNTSKVGDKL